jgi:hypothetical protein
VPLADSPNRNEFPAADAEESPPDTVTPGRAAYNFVSDTVFGLNVRASDNKLQATVALGMALLFAAVGAIATALIPDWGLEWYYNALLGAVGGMFFGIFASGLYLMIYRAWRHLQGKHD